MEERELLLERLELALDRGSGRSPGRTGRKKACSTGKNILQR